MKLIILQLSMVLNSIQLPKDSIASHRFQLTVSPIGPLLPLGPDSPTNP